VIIALALLQRGIDHSSTVGLASTFLPLLIGAAGVASRWRFAPPLLLLALVLGYLNLPLIVDYLAALIRPGALPRHAPGYWAALWTKPGDWFTDTLLCTGVLLYVMAQYRLQALMVHIVPPDPRRKKPRAINGMTRQLCRSSGVRRCWFRIRRSLSWSCRCLSGLAWR
jgi:hypothetical protein